MCILQFSDARECQKVYEECQRGKEIGGRTLYAEFSTQSSNHGGQQQPQQDSQWSGYTSGRGADSDTRRPSASQNSSGYTLTVSNLPYTATEQDIQREFVDAFKVALSLNDQGRSRGVAHVTFATEEQCSAALESCNHKTLGGRPMRGRIQRDDDGRQQTRDFKSDSGNRRDFGGSQGQYDGSHRDFDNSRRDSSNNRRGFGNSRGDFRGNRYGNTGGSGDFRSDQRSYSGAPREHGNGQREFSSGQREYGGNQREYGGNQRDYGGGQRDFGNRRGRPNENYGRNDRDGGNRFQGGGGGNRFGQRELGRDNRSQPAGRGGRDRSPVNAEPVRGYGNNKGPRITSAVIRRPPGGASSESDSSESD
ncbi:unnamed protein product [Calicophoron daubneyi]